jgi:zinc protease
VKRAVRPAALVAAMLLAVAASAVPAQPFDTPPPPAAPRPLQIAAPAEVRLPNGLRLVVAERRGLPLVTARLIVLAGAEVDPPSEAGLAALTAGLLTRGTTHRDAPAQAAAAEALGGTLDSGAGWQQSSVGITVTTPRLDAALALVAEAVTEPAFAQAEIDRLRDETLDELKVAYTRPGTLAALAANRMLFGDGAYGHPSAGTPKSLPRIARDDVVRLHRERYRPDQAVLVLAGDVDLAQAQQLVRRHFGGWTAGPGEAPATPAAAGRPSANALMLIDMGDSGQAGVALALPLPAAGAKDQAAGEVASAVLGGGYSSRLNLEIRIKRGLSYGAASAFDARRQAGVLHAAVQTKNDSAAEVVALVQAQLDALAAAPVPDDELAARKAMLIGRFSRSVEATDGLAGQVAALVVEGRPVAELTTRIAALSAVDAAAVQAYAKAHFGAAGRRVAVAGEAKVFAAALKAAAKEGQPAPQVVEAAVLDLGP